MWIIYNSSKLYICLKSNNYMFLLFITRDDLFICMFENLESNCDNTKEFTKFYPTIALQEPHRLRVVLTEGEN